MGRLAAYALLAAVLLPATAAQSLPIQISYRNVEGEGFFDGERGVERRAALELAAVQWSSLLAGSTPIVIAADMQPLGGTGTSALLASAGPVTLHRNFRNGIRDTWYAAALANTLSGDDLNGSDEAEIVMTFNADVDGPEILGSVGWYYGSDGHPGSDIDFLTVALHEIGHGLGFAEVADLYSGGWRTPTDQPGIFDRMLARAQIGPFAELRDAERLASVVSPNLFWTGAAATAFNGSAPVMFTPDPVQPGSSVAHWDRASAPGELMSPFIEGAVHNPGLLLPALVDMGWQLAVPSPTPRAPLATPTATSTPSNTIPPTPQPSSMRRDYLYVADFDAANVAVVDPSIFSVIDRIDTGDGPISAATSTDGRRVYVANFHSGTLSIISTHSKQVLATIPVGTTANGIAVTPDGNAVVLSDTWAGEAVIVDPHTHRVRAHAPAGSQPTAVAVAPDGLSAFVADYGAEQVTMIDIATGLRRAIILTGYSNLLSIAFADTGAGFVVGVGRVLTLDANALTAGDSGIAVQWTNESVAVRPDGSELYVAGNREAGQNVAFVDPHTLSVRRRSDVENLPGSLALSTDQKTLYVANAGSGSLSFVDLQSGGRSNIRIGGTPMGITVAAVQSVCAGDCNGDGAVTVDELLKAVAIALEQQDVLSCTAVDANDDERVSVDEILQAIGPAIGGCVTTL